jgi:hypothetical protein
MRFLPRIISSFPPSTLTVLSFNELSKTISSSWKVLDNETKKYCYVVAEIIRKRHDRLVEAGGMCCLPTTDFINPDYILRDYPGENACMGIPPTQMTNDLVSKDTGMSPPQLESLPCAPITKCDALSETHDVPDRPSNEYPGNTASMGISPAVVHVKCWVSKDAEIPPPQQAALSPCVASIMPGNPSSESHDIPDQPDGEYPSKNAYMDISRVVNVKLLVPGDAEIPPSPQHAWLPCAPITSGDVFRDTRDVPYRPGREYPGENVTVGIPSTVRERSTANIHNDSVMEILHQYREFQILHQDWPSYWATIVSVNDDLDRSNVIAPIPEPTPSSDLVSCHQKRISAIFDMWLSKQGY